MLYGFAGKILRVNLTTSEVSDIPTEKYVPEYIGGRGVATRIYWEEVPPEVEALDPENKLIFMTGPLQGTIFPSSRMALVSKSPQTYPVEAISDSNCGGFFAMDLKYAGYDGIIVEGKAKSPVYLYIYNGKAYILDANALWGLTTFATQEEIWRKHGWKTRIFTIGPAGENKCRSAIILTDSGAAFGQCGFGGVMGSKNLKAIAAYGTGSIELAKPGEALELRQYMDALVHNPKPGEVRTGYKEQEIVGSYPNTSYYAGALGLIEDEKKALVKTRGVACGLCPESCKMGVQFPNRSVPSGAAMCDEITDRAKVNEWFYEPGAYISPEETWKWTQLLQELGINVYEVPDGRASGSAAGAQSLLNELIKEGILTEENTGWPVDKFGSIEFGIQTIKDVAYRQGFGDIWANGIFRAAEHIANDPKFGPNREKVWYYLSLMYPKAGNFRGYLIHMPGKMIAHYYPEFLYWAIATRDPSTKHIPFSFLYSPPAQIGSPEWAQMLMTVMNKYAGTDKPAMPPGIEEVEKAVRWFEQVHWENDSLLICDFWFQGTKAYYSQYTEDGYGDMEIGSKMLNVVTGVDWSQEKLWEKCEKLWMLERAIACREGRRSTDDEFEETFCTDSSASIDRSGVRIDMEVMRKGLDNLYALVGWNADGIPTRARLEEVDLKDVADDLEARGVL